MATSPMPLMDNLSPGGPQAGQTSDSLGNRQVAPRRAIDRLLMTQQQSQPRTMAFPEGIPEQQPPQPAASSFMSAVLGNSQVR